MKCNPHTPYSIEHTFIMSTSIDIQEVLYPFLYNAPSELTVYTPHAIEKTVEYIKTRADFNQTDYKSCKSLEETQEEIFGIWWSIWGDDRIGYPVQGNISNAIEELIPGDAYWEMIKSSRKRFVDILEQVVFIAYSIPETTTADAIRKTIKSRFIRLENAAEKANTEAYEEYAY